MRFRWDKEGVDDWDKVPLVDVREAPRRSTSSLGANLGASPGYVTVRFQYSRHIGPRQVHGAVVIQFSPASTFQFTSAAQWPTSADYSAAIERAVRDVLTVRGTLSQTSCRLLSVGWDAVASCEVGFESAASAGTNAAFGV